MLLHIFLFLNIMFEITQEPLWMMEVGGMEDQYGSRGQYDRRGDKNPSFLGTFLPSLLASSFPNMHGCV